MSSVEVNHPGSPLATSSTMSLADVQEAGRQRAAREAEVSRGMWAGEAGKEHRREEKGPVLVQAYPRDNLNWRHLLSTYLLCGAVLCRLVTSSAVQLSTSCSLSP
jgi:hypothetical protein